MNNTPGIWNDIISLGDKVKCFWIYGFDFNPEFLELYLLYLSYESDCSLPKYNKHTMVSTQMVFSSLIKMTKRSS